MLENCYMSKVVILLSDAKYFVAFLNLIEKLQDAKIACEVLLSEEEFPHEEASLYITDCPVCLQKIKNQGLPSLAYLHEDNRNQNMGSLYAMENPSELDVSYLDRVYRRYMGIPWKILETERCILRECIVEDVDAFYEIYKDESITRYTDPLYSDINKEKAYMQNYIETVYPFFEYGLWTVILKETGKIIGRAGISARDGFDTAEMGYIIGVPWQQKGIATEVCGAILEYAKKELGMDEIRALIRPGNDVSFKLCNKLGFIEDKEVTIKDILHRQVIWKSAW